MSKEQPDYLSYLLRLWRDIHRGEGQAVWHASLESSLTGKRQGFSSLDDLFAFLRQETRVVVDGAEKDNDA
jgi:hypothetical protein